MAGIDCVQAGGGILPLSRVKHVSVRQVMQYVTDARFGTDDISPIRVSKREDLLNPVSPAMSQNVGLTPFSQKCHGKASVFHTTHV